jgi:hypothetical protein
MPKVKPKYHPDVINKTLGGICKSRDSDNGFKAVLMGSGFKHQLIDIAKCSGAKDPHEEVNTLVGMDIVTCKGITGPEAYFFETTLQARIFRDQINEKIASGILWEAIAATVERMIRYDQSQFEETEIHTMGDLK